MWLLLTYEELPRSLFYRRFFEEWAIPQELSPNFASNIKQI